MLVAPTKLTCSSALLKILILLTVCISELVAYKTEDVCQLMIDGFPKKYQVKEIYVQYNIIFL